MSFLAGWAGAAAQATDTSMKEWRRLFQVDQDLEFRRTEAQTNREFENRWRELQLAAQGEQFDRTMQYNMGKYWMDNFNTLDPTQQDQIATWMEEAKNPFAQGFRSSIRRSIFSNPDQAIGYLDQLNSGQGQERFDTFRVESAARMAGEMQGLTGSNLDEYVQRYMDLAEQRNTGAEEIDANLLEQTRIGTNQARATLAQTEAETGRVDAQTASIYQDIDIQDDLRGILLEQETARLGILQSEEVQAGIRAGRLDEEITASLAESYARVRGLDNENELFEATFDSMVDKMVSEASIARSEAAYLVATESARIALAQGNVELLNTNIAKLNSEIANIEANTERTGVLMESDHLAITEAKVKIAQDLVESGSVEMLGAVGRDLLASVVGEDAVDALVADLSEVAGSNRDEDDKLVDANLRIAVAQADYEERTLESRIQVATSEAQYSDWRAQNAERIQEFNEWATREGLRLDERRVDLLFAQYDAQQALAEREAAGTGATVPVTDVINEIRLARGQSPADVEGLWGEYKQAEADLLLLQGAVSGASPLGPDQLQSLILRYNPGDSMMDASGAIDFQALTQYVSEIATQKRNQAISGATSFLTLGAGQGVIFSPQELGFSSDLYNAAVTPLAIAVTDEEPDTDVTGFLRTSAAAAPETGYTMFHANTLWQQAEERGLRPSLEAAGITNPSQLLEQVNGASVTRAEYESALMPAANLYTQMTGEQPDLRTLDGVQNFEVFAEATIDAFERARQWAASAPPNVGTVGAATREASRALAQLSADTGLSIDQLREFGLVSSSWVSGAEYLNVSAAQRVLPGLIGQLSGGIPAAHALYNW